MLIIVDALFTSVIVAAKFFLGVTYVHWLLHASIKITPG
jgi:hypothetical protein